MVILKQCIARACALAVALAQLTSVAPVAAADDTSWGSWAELGGYLGGDKAQRGEAAVFLPLGQHDTAMLFADVRGKLFEDDISEINGALGYRWMDASGWNFGGWLGADRRNTSLDNSFWAAAGGLEALSDVFDVRVNGYWSLTDPKLSPAAAVARIEGSQVFITGGQEIPLSGFDGEAGVRIPLVYLGLDEQRHALRAYAGGFFFDDDDAPEDVSGPKVRIEYRLDDAIAAVPGSRLTLESEWRSDSVRGGHVEAGVRFRLPFAALGSTAQTVASKTAQWRRMTDGLERDTDIVTVASGREPVEDLLTGVDFDRVVYADATTGVSTPAANAGANTLILVDGASGVISGQQVLQASQTALGGGGVIQVRGMHSGVSVPLTGPGQRPTFTNAANLNNLLMADRTHLAGVAVVADPALGAAGVALTSNQFVVLQDVDIANAPFAGVAGLNNNVVRLIDVSVSSTAGLAGAFFNNNNTVSVEDSTLTGSGFGLLFNNQNTVSVANTTITNPGVDGINMLANNTLSVSGTTFSSIGIDGIAFTNNNVISVSNSVFTNIGADALFGNNTNTLTISGVTVTNAGQDFIDVNDFNQVTVTNSTGTGLAGRAFLIDDDNSLTVVGGGYSSQAEGVDADDRNAIVLTNTSFTGTGTQEGIDISDNNTFVMTGTSVTVNGNRALEFSNGNAVTVNFSTLNGTPTNTVAYDGVGNTVSGTGNVDTTVPTVAFCSNAGVQTGTIGFTNGATCP